MFSKLLAETSTKPSRKNWVIGLGTGLLIFLAALISGTISSCVLREENITPEKVYRFIERELRQAPRPPGPEAKNMDMDLWNRLELEPGFVYAVAFAESSLDARASAAEARGMMQLKRPAWETATTTPYREHFDWRENIRAGIGYLRWCRHFLEKEGKFSYPLLAAAYRYGPFAVKRANFDLSQLPAPKNKIYQQFFAGNITPLERPSGKE